MKYEIWMEGFMMNGCYSSASLVGVSEGKTFEDAVRKWYKENPSPTFDPVRMTEHGCKLHRNEREARRNFG